MPKTKRTTWLIGLLVGVTLLTLAEESLTSVVLSPFADQTRTRDALRRKVANADRELAKIELAQRSLRDANRQSLPPDPSVAATLYQNWLIELAHSSSLTNAVITPGQPLLEEGLGHRLSMTLQADATAPQIALCLDRFHQLPLLHRISHATITETGGPTKETLRVSLTCEALALTTSEPRQTLLCEEDSNSTNEVTLTVASTSSMAKDNAAKDATPKDTVAKDTVTSSLVTLFQTSRPFHRLEPTPPKPAVTRPVATKPAPPVNPLSQIRFVGTWHNGTHQEAWFFDEARRREFVVTEQSPLKIESLQGRLVRITPDHLHIEVAGQTQHLKLGQRLSQLGRQPNAIP